MNKTITKLLAIGLTAAVLMSGCSDSGSDTDNDNGSGSVSDSGSVMDPADSNGSGSDTASDSKYGSIKTVESPAGFTGNTGDVSIESGDTYAVITVRDFGSITVKLFPEAAPEGVQNFIDLADSGYYTDREIHRVVADFMLQGGSRNGDGLSTPEDPSFSVEYNANMRHFYGALCYANAGGVNGSQFYIVNRKSYKSVSEADLQSNVDYYEGQIELAKTYLAEAESDEEREYYESVITYIESPAATARSQLRALQEMTEEMEAKYKEVGGYQFLDGGYTVFGQTVDGFDVIDAISAVKVEQQSGMDEISHPVEKIVIESVEIFTAE